MKKLPAPASLPIPLLARRAYRISLAADEPLRVVTHVGVLSPS